MPHVTINWTISQRDSFEVSHELAKKIKALIVEEGPVDTSSNQGAPVTQQMAAHDFSDQGNKDRVAAQDQQDAERAEELAGAVEQHEETFHSETGETPPE